MPMHGASSQTETDHTRAIALTVIYDETLVTEATPTFYIMNVGYLHFHDS